MMINGGRGRPLNRFAPRMPAQNYKTYSTHSPIGTHYRKATCAEIDCTPYREGWTLNITGLPPELVYTARNSGRHYKVVKYQGDVYLVFEAGQPCFDAAQHRVSLERPAFYFVGRGDHRLFDVHKAKQHSTAENWIDDMSNHQDKLKTVIERG